MRPQDSEDKMKTHPLARWHILTRYYYSNRINLFFVSVALKLIASGISGAGIYLSSIAISLLGTFLWLAWFAAIFAVTLPETEHLLQKWSRWLKPAAMFITLSIILIGLLWGTIVTILASSSSGSTLLSRYSGGIASSIEDIFLYNDTTALFQQAGENLLEGKNPYAEANIITASINYNVPGIQVTPLRRGVFADVFPYPNLNELNSFWQEAQKNPGIVPVEIESRYGYPAGSFILLVPFLAAGIQDIRIIFAILMLISLVIVIWLAKSENRIILILAFLVSLELPNIIAMGDTGVMQFPFLLLAWALWKKHWQTSALMMGLAITIKQVSWLYAVFYLVLILRETGVRRFISTAGISGGVFLVFNLPFIILDPALWLSSMASILTAPLFPLGVGIISSVTSGLVIIKNSLIFNAIAVLVLAGGLIWYYRNCRKYPYTGLILSILPFFFAWRSMWGYFFFADFIVLACILIYNYPLLTNPLRHNRNRNC